MNGKELKAAIRNSGLPINELLERTGIKKTTFYTLYKDATVEQHYIDRLAKAGVKFGENEQKRTLPEDNINVLKATLFMMEQQNKIMEARIEELKLHNQDLRKNNETLNTVVMSKLIGNK